MPPNNSPMKQPMTDVELRGMTHEEGERRKRAISNKEASGEEYEAEKGRVDDDGTFFLLHLCLRLILLLLQECLFLTLRQPLAFHLLNMLEFMLSLHPEKNLCLGGCEGLLGWLNVLQLLLVSLGDISEEFLGWLSSRHGWVG